MQLKALELKKGAWRGGWGRDPSTQPAYSAARIAVASPNPFAWPLIHPVRAIGLWRCCPVRFSGLLLILLLQKVLDVINQLWLSGAVSVGSIVHLEPWIERTTAIAYMPSLKLHVVFFKGRQNVSW